MGYGFRSYVRNDPEGGGRSYGCAGMNLSINTSSAKAQPRLMLQPRAATLHKNQLRLMQPRAATLHKNQLRLMQPCAATFSKVSFGWCSFGWRRLPRLRCCCCASCGRRRMVRSPLLLRRRLRDVIIVYFSSPLEMVTGGCCKLAINNYQ